jgi:alkylation response protein AidB-like acyl-CoA dehydrogenase
LAHPPKGFFLNQGQTMQLYHAPLRDMRFVLHELHCSAAHLAAIGATDVTSELIDNILEEAGKVATDILLPLNAPGDAEGCHYENGHVRTPKGFNDAYKLFCAAGWTGLGGSTEYDGQGLPEILGKMVEEIFCAANLSFSLTPNLTHGAILALAANGSDEQKRHYLPKMMAGTWAGTMNLTEPQCGTDLGLLRTKAVPQQDGSFKITGAKIFITAGDHDLTENIIHLVLARLPDAPAGVKGISLFLVPKFIPDENNNPGARNGVFAAGIEHKMGIKASPTCQMNFDGATGWLIGEAHKGLAAMFVMMNAERLSIGIQGLGIAELAYQSAVFYAKDRLQGRAVAGAKYPEKPADPIIVHPDVRRMLMTMRAQLEGARALSGWVAAALDREARATDFFAREEAGHFIAFITPVVKALFTDMGFELASLAVQIYGGHGYIRDHGIEQILRDARIAMIYEGTNGIQAIDLAARKLPAKNGALLAAFKNPIAAYIAEHRGQKDITPLAAAFAHFESASAFILENGGRDPEETGAAAVDYLRLTGLTAMAYLWARMAEIAAAQLASAGDDRGFYEAKLITAQFFNERILPQTASLLSIIMAGKTAVMAMPEDSFGNGPF